MNRRENPRIEIKLPCHVTSPSLWLQTSLFTENISRSGVMVAWRGQAEQLPMPAPGQVLTIEVELPATHDFGQKCIHCQGMVTRVSDAGCEYPQVALRVNYMVFRSFHDQIRSVQALQPAASPWMA